MTFLKAIAIASAFVATSIIASNAYAETDLRQGFQTVKVNYSKHGVDLKKRTRFSAAPLAYQLFCLKNKGECRPGGASHAIYSASLVAKLEVVNQRVNRGMTFRSERKDTWSVNSKSGDCEDFVLTKRHRLLRMGIPAGALRIAAVRNSKGEGHAILVVKTDRGDFVLDNARPNIVKRNKTGYRLIAMSSANPMSWTRN